MSCLNNDVCGNKNRYHFEWCNFNGVDGYYYEAAPNITCTRDDISDLYPMCNDCRKGFIDCCADTREECCIRSETSFPTSTPTSSPTSLCIENHYYQKEEQCHFYEIQNTDISYYTEHSMICCSNDRSDCCSFNHNILYGTIGGLCLLVITIVSHLVYTTKSTKVMPENKIASINPV
jgi:hypothetical protein